MGEEKPDEELMGKRKSSPRLSTASLDADILRIASLAIVIHGSRIIFWTCCTVPKLPLFPDNPSQAASNAVNYRFPYPFRGTDRV